MPRRKSLLIRRVLIAVLAFAAAGTVAGHRAPSPVGGATSDMLPPMSAAVVAVE